MTARIPTTPHQPWMREDDRWTWQNCSGFRWASPSRPAWSGYGYDVLSNNVHDDPDESMTVERRLLSEAVSKQSLRRIAPARKARTVANPFPVGCRVLHAMFGDGAVTASDGKKVAVHFDRHGDKEMDIRFCQPNMIRVPARKATRAKGRVAVRKPRRSDTVIAFLLGESALDGVWYGDEPPGRPPHWWRTTLRAWLLDNGIPAPRAPKGGGK